MDATICRQCGATVESGTTTCWLCRQPIAQLEGTAQPASILHGAVVRAPSTFGLSSLMLVIALIAVCLGLLREAPGLGILLAIVATPAVARTWVATSRRQAKGQPMTHGERWLAFAGSLGVVAATGVASVAAFSAMCFGTTFLGAAAASGRGGSDLSGVVWGAVIGGVLGLILAGYVFYRLVRWLWPIKDKS